MSTKRTHRITIAVLGLWPACKTEGEPASTDSAGSAAEEAGETSGAPVDAPTYYEDIAPILVENCQGCHVDGGIGPFPLTTYEEAKQQAGVVEAVTAERYMPPFLADGSGDCQEYKNARWLSDEDIDLIARWRAGGLLEGDPANAPAPAQPLPHLGVDTTHEAAMEMPYQPDTSLDDDYRCFVVDPGVAEDMFMTHFEVVPGNETIVHHVILYQPSSDAAVADAVRQDSDTPGYGYTCFGGAGVQSNMIAAWAPGETVAAMPEDTGVRIAAGRPIVMQVHYNNQAGDGDDLSRVDLKLASSVGKELYPFFFSEPSKLVLEPGLEETKVVMQGSLAGLGLPLPQITLHGVGPHMHKRGTKMIMTVQREGSSEQECLIDVLRWDFNWQLGYYFKEPIVIGANDTIYMQCTYDTEDDTEVTRWGEGTGDEMCLMLMMATW